MNLKFYNTEEKNNTHIEVRKDEEGLWMGIEDEDFGPEFYNFQSITLSHDDAEKLAKYIVGEKNLMVRISPDSEGGRPIKIKNRQGEYSKRGYFHKWDTKLAQHEGVYFTTTVAIVEHADGWVERMDPENIMFEPELNGPPLKILGRNDF